MVMSEAVTIRIGDWMAVRSTGQLSRGEQTLHLEPRVMDVLFALAEAPGQAVSLQQLMDAAWGDIAVAPESVYQAIAVLRRALAKNSGRTEYIATVPKRGYRLVVPVTAVPLREVPGASEEIRSRGDVRAKPTGRPLILVWAALLLIITVLVAQFLTSHSELGTTPRSIVVVATDGVDGALAERLVRRFLQSDVIRLLTPSVPMYGGTDMDEQVLMARTLGADFVVSLSELGENRAQVDVLDLSSDELQEIEHFSIDYTDPEAADEDATRKLETIIGASRVSGDDARISERSISEAARQESLGRYFMQRRFARDGDPRLALRQARTAFQQAIEADDNFVPAWTGLALAQVLRAQYGPREDMTMYLATGRAAIDKALTLAPDSAESYAALGLGALFEGDYAAGRAALERAVSLDPTDPMLMRWLAGTMGLLGYYRKAATLAVRAAETAPFSPEILSSASLHSYYAGDHEAAVKYSEAVLDLEPGDFADLSNQFVAYRESGQLDRAIATGRLLLESLQSSGDESGHFNWVIGMVSDLYIDLGLLETARSLALPSAQDSPAVYETVKALVRLHLAAGDIQSARRQIANWAALPESAVETSEVAVNATIAGMNALGLRLMESLPDGERLPDGMNPMLETGRWLKTDYLVFASLPAVYRALLYIRSAETEEARRLLDDSGRFLDYWSEQGLSLNYCLYLRAAVYAMENEIDAGVKALRAAIESGWRDAWRIRHDPALESLRAHPEFVKALSELDNILMNQRKNVIAREAQPTLLTEG